MKKIVLIFIVILVCHSSISAQVKKKKKTTTTTTTKSTSASGSTSNTSSSSTLGGIVSSVGGLLGGSSSSSSGSMTNELAAKGLKEALSLGTTTATNKLGALDGFLGNALVKILLPPEAKKLESTLRSIGMGHVCDQVITSLNRSAEGAVVEAAPIFMAAITQMTISDAIQILTGGPNSATDYLKRTSGQALMQKMEPIIQSNLDRTQATQYWSQAMTAYNQVPFVQKINPNLNQYVTQRAADGIFLMVAQEEQKIRSNPAERIGSILQDVFGWADKNK